jgi:hypothetical protein
MEKETSNKVEADLPLKKRLQWNRKIPLIIGMIQGVIACVTLPIIILERDVQLRTTESGF